ncbi:type VII toxin-antitoxin system HepT family RNase toxin [Nitratifractor salsuginis]|uniref:DUF86 domain-containing protein n=1 Tax=Nitratifractor salsuginis (strain DSM 16511 / JCM 12458 / E9I37-1) TaxID=749222 RepID=E6WZC6_NITSE|nr:HepT-like ribonuclease domain-containing protein [Nitratifractor salsuginis]ADV46638.1 protein of unknown function DUF86 [Nitratifractor salsuginis DSM 16511]
MDFHDYLESCGETAERESRLLEELAGSGELSFLQRRAARSSLQILIENAIGKSRRILKHYNCPTVPKTGRDAASFLYETGVIDDELYRELSAAIGFRNAMIHDYMDFSEELLEEMVHSGRWRVLVDYLKWVPELTEVQVHRIEGFLL